MNLCKGVEVVWDTFQKSIRNICISKLNSRTKLFEHFFVKQRKLNNLKIIFHEISKHIQHI